MLNCLRAAIAIAAALFAGCSNRPSIVGCVDATVCTLSPGGQCLPSPVGFDVCAYPAGECPSGLSWSPQAGDLAGDCVAAADDVDASVTDGPPPDSPDPSARWVLLAANARTLNGNAAEPLRLYRSDQATVFTSMWASQELDWSRSVAWADFDRDGHLDFAVGNGYGTRARNRIYRNDGAGSFVAHWTAPDAIYTLSIGWGDVDGDNDLDMVALIKPSTGGNFMRLYRNTAGTFSAGDNVLDGGGDTLRELDFNGADLALATSAGAAVYRNNGSGAFTRIWSSPVDDVSAIKWGDYDRDGDQDLVIGLDNGVKVYQRTGATTFTLAFSSAVDLNPAVNVYAPSVAWLDYDGDQDLDVVAAHCQLTTSGCDAAQNRVYRNSGGTFAVGWTSPETGIGMAVSVGDYDNDGRPDLAFGNNGFNRVYRNTGGAFALTWTSTEQEITNDIAWATFAP